MTDDKITFRFLAKPQDATSAGTTVQAGSVLEWIDRAGYACAVAWSGLACVTAYVGNVNFRSPIRPGDVVEARARIMHTGRTSIHVHVEVVSSDARGGDQNPATDCILVFVAVDADGHPTPVRHWDPPTVADLEFAIGATARIEARSEIRAEMQAQTYSDRGTAPVTTFRFLASPADANFGGNAHGGTVLRWIDDAARTSATAWCGRDAVAVYSGGIHFYSPIHIGDIVEVEARPIHTGDRSVHIAIHVRAADPRTGDFGLTTQCMSIYVVTGTGRSGEAAGPVPRFEPVSDEDRRLEAHGRRLIAMRKALSDATLGAAV